MPSSQVSRKALICSTSRVASASLPSLTSRLRADDCQLRAELDPVRRVDVDHLDLAAQRLAFGEARHDVAASRRGSCGSTSWPRGGRSRRGRGRRARRRTRTASARARPRAGPRCGAGSRSGPAGRSSPGCRSAARRRRGPRRRARPCPSRRAAGRASGRAGSGPRRAARSPGRRTRARRRSGGSRACRRA